MPTHPVRVLDLMIAAESLFLSETDEKYRGELRFRLATRAAFLLGTTPAERVRLFKFLGRAYVARSVIVHGGVLSQEGLRRLNGVSGSVHEFADDLEGALRDACTGVTQHEVVVVDHQALGEHLASNRASAWPTTSRSACRS